jgi:hypothetical protein
MADQRGQPQQLIVAATMILLASCSTIATANPLETIPLQVGQTNLIGQCRRITTDYTGVFKAAADTMGTRVAALRAGTVVRLADGGNGRGWIKIDAPKEGYLEAKYLAVISCPASLSQQPTVPSSPPPSP